MKYNLLLAAILLLAGFPAAAQDAGSLAFVNQLDDKASATWGDAVRFFVLTMGGQSAGFRKDIQFLNSRGISTNIGLAEGDTLRKGAAALMVARYLKLSDSLWYSIFGTQRYAFRACASAGIMPANGSERDIISGPELIEIMRITGEMSGGDR